MKFVGIMQYDGDLKLPANYLVPPPEISQVSGEYLVGSGVRTFACSETQKFGHVTFFWNGNRSGFFDSKLETFLEVSIHFLFASFLFVPRPICSDNVVHTTFIPHSCCTSAEAVLK